MRQYRREFSPSYSLNKRNFVPEAGDDPVVEADILFSPLCEDLGRGYFRFDPQVRALFSKTWLRIILLNLNRE